VRPRNLDALEIPRMNKRALTFGIIMQGALLHQCYQRNQMFYINYISVQRPQRVNTKNEEIEFEGETVTESTAGGRRPGGGPKKIRRLGYRRGGLYFTRQEERLFEFNKIKRGGKTRTRIEEEGCTNTVSSLSCHLFLLIPKV
jgi:hypothetical protein